MEQSITQIVPKYRLGVCEIQKNMATISYSIFCFLNNPNEFRSWNRTISTDYWNVSMCGKFPTRESYDDTIRVIGPNSTLFTVVRHPFERFLSAYLDKCINSQRFHRDVRCFGCGTDLRCFVLAIHRVLSLYHRGAIRKTPMVRIMVRHFAPQTWYCDFQKHKYDYRLIRYHSGPGGKVRVAKEFDEVLASAGVPADLRAVIASEMQKGTTLHSTFGSATRPRLLKQMLSDRHIMKHLLEMYIHDFIELGFIL
ncbi:hypothetical protein Q1695_010441 [Nippostrongylus brasiliensis]|nr:hypothetical protein Q1695_010441 [Nippostrongylus brasiliensis]